MTESYLLRAQVLPKLYITIILFGYNLFASVRLISVFGSKRVGEVFHKETGPARIHYYSQLHSKKKKEIVYNWFLEDRQYMEVYHRERGVKG